MSTLDNSKHVKNAVRLNVKKAQILQQSIPTIESATEQPEQSTTPRSRLKEGALPPRHLIRQFDGERALRDAEAAGLLTPSVRLNKRTNPSPEMVALATVYVTALFTNTETPPSNEDKIAKISEVASFYSEPHRQERFKNLVSALFS